MGRSDLERTFHPDQEQLMSARLSCLLVAGVLLLAGGCQKVTLDKEITLKPEEMPKFLFDAPAYQQKVTVTITPKDAGVSAYLFKDSNTDAVEKALNADKEPAADLLLASQVGKKDPEPYTIEATVPAKTAYTLLVRAAAKTTGVKIKLVGK
jgi:hypothetical protein